KSAQIREILISESAWEEMTCLFAPSLGFYGEKYFSYFLVVFNAWRILFSLTKKITTEQFK
ncbi:hypothetical protein, partial [Escherichia coli]|uniref:hypothetical protein n=1 Tax=Escherichia coli TaxID=562 RepID=UPI000FFB3935